MKKALIWILFFLYPHVLYGSPILASAVNDPNADFIIITINGQEASPVNLLSKYSRTAFWDLKKFHLKSGFHEIKLRSGNDAIESEDIKFFMLVTFEKGYLTYEIIPDPANDDPKYFQKFWDLLQVTVGHGDEFFEY